MRMKSYKRIFEGRENGADMAAFAEAQWADLKAYLTENGAFTPYNGETAHRLVVARTCYEFLLPSVMAEGEVQAGPNGGDVFNQRFAVLLKYADQAEKLETRLHERTGKKAVEKPPQRKPVAADAYLSGRSGARPS